MTQKSPDHLTRRNVVLSGAAAMAGVAASIHQSQPVIAQKSSESSQEQQILGKRLTGKVAIVTGAARAIGRACAVSLAKEGANVTVMDIANPNAFPYLNYPMASMEDLAETKRLVEEQGSRCLSIQGDVRSMEQMRSIVERTINEFGKVDITVANAGLVPSVPLTDMSDRSCPRAIAISNSR